MNDYTTKCPNCGAPLHPDTTDIIKCTYCGSSYQGKPEIKEAKSWRYVQNSTGWNNEQNSSKDADADGSMKGGCALFVIVFIIIIAAIIKKDVDRRNADEVLYDTTIVDSNFIENNLQEQMDATKTVIKKTNPEPEIFIKSKVYNADSITNVSITYQNNTTEDVITRIEFTYELFDKEGLIINTGKENIAISGNTISKGETESEVWSPIKYVPNAKKVIVKLKRVEFDNNTVWKY